MSTSVNSALPIRTLAALASGALAALALSGCADHSHMNHGGDAAPATTSSAPASAPSASSATSGASGAATSPVAVTQAWAKALPEPGKMGMTAVFGDLVNHSGTAVTVTSATTSASDHAELHKTEGGKMAPVPSFTIPADGTFSLKPGGNHVMVMNVMKPLRPGDLVKVTLTTSDGGKIEFSAVAKTFTGAGEKYAK